MKNLTISIFFALSSLIVNAQESFEISFEHVDKTVFGTFTVPAGEGPFPTILIIPGTGANDRDGTFQLVGGNAACLYPDLENEILSPLKDLSDAFVDSGFAVLRYDKLEFTYPPSQLGEISFNKLWLPGESGIDYLKTRTEVDTNRIVLIGHSEGSSLIPIMGKERNDVSALISLGGPRTPFDSLLAYQLVNIAETCGGNVNEAQNQANQILAYYNLIRSNTWNESTPALFGVPAGVWYDYVQATDVVSDNYNEANLPTLFVGLELDINVPPAELARFEEEVTITDDFWLIPELNHYLTPNDNPRVAEALTDTIIFWLRQNGILSSLKDLNQDESGFRLYPNPAEDHINIKFYSATYNPRSVKVFNQFGQVLFSSENTNSSIKLNTSSFPSGIYHMVVIDNNSIITRRIVKN